MLEKAMSFWHNLIGAAPAPASLQDERRLWVRYAIDLQGNVQLAANGQNEKFLANVRDLSLGGANVLIDRPIDVGQMLTLELPAEKNEVRSVLACVVRVTPQPNGVWSMGCVFSRELSHSDLVCFRSPKVESDDANKRVRMRFDCALKANCRRANDPASETRPVDVLNLSSTGIGLSVRGVLELGSLLSVDLLDKSGRNACTILACVVHSTLRESGDYSLGCNFIRELTETELQSLV
jgi:c-di-GMP-binding flagellar brake protein YcgR